ncbi:hypothetical protein SKAU_G00127680 [Synaphobranchus kaupii]|uniref:Uncharacterized protein n=1 Tax=Synaphobranchus kaupii TaxID=118154 RepID=A0A9Q1FPX0_SYNKA|nr:hypothetical protein SKAU_G00127680 [Synaphobranchus kaupii]
MAYVTGTRTGILAGYACRDAKEVRSLSPQVCLSSSQLVLSDARHCIAEGSHSPMTVVRRNWSCSKSKAAAALWS